MLFKKIKEFMRYFILIFLTALCVFSFYILIINATRANADIQKGFSLLPGKSFVKNLNNVLNNDNLPVIKSIINSLLIASASSVLTVYFSSLTAYAIHAYNFRFKQQIFMFILLIMMVPSQVSALGFVRWMGQLGFTDSFIPLILPGIAAPTTFFFMKQYMDSNLSLEIINAARVDGAKEFYTFNKVVIPIMKPAIAVQIIFAFIGSWNNYFIPSLILKKDAKKTLPILIAQLRSADYLKFDMGQVYMLMFIAIIPVSIAYLIFSKNIIGGIAEGSVKG